MKSSISLTHQVSVGSIVIGGGNPIRIQSMTDTPTEETEKTINQIKLLADAGSELVRVSVYNSEASFSVVEIKNKLVQSGYIVPIIGDFHYNGNKILQSNHECAVALDKYRINPGNVGRGSKHDVNFLEIIEVAKKFKKPIRIGVNWGSIDQQLLTNLMNDNAKDGNPLTSEQVLEKALIQSALFSANFAVSQGLPRDKIIVSCKTSSVNSLLSVYRSLRKQCSYPLHVGLTEAGMGTQGIVQSSVAIGILLSEGIGETIRVSVTPSSQSDRSQEVKIAQFIVQSLGKRNFSPKVVSCPGCGRTSSSYFQTLAEHVNQWLSLKFPIIKETYSGVENLTIAVMGCVVNGPGEGKQADIGISLPGNGEDPVAPVYILGKKHSTLKGDQIAEEFISIVENHIHEHFQKK
ncbi:MAG: flavodoxin-dependent (E)-4-hydroxy-3-methylbut-2-enyl-diphosphate synthase [Methylacidiphilales bacterium]|nr:flavodoxin-dependent (E)-4-hydroxy-3-methylbut-2-enyl-diphosphate synthase [Candidatus Methylacidiphilales bacterium]